MVEWYWLLIAGFAGGAIGVLVTSLCVAAKRGGDEYQVLNTV